MKVYKASAKALVLNLEYRSPIIEYWSWTCGTIGMHVLKLKQADSLYNIYIHIIREAPDFPFHNFVLLLCALSNCIIIVQVPICIYKACMPTSYI